MAKKKYDSKGECMVTTTELLIELNRCVGIMRECFYRVYRIAEDYPFFQIFNRALEEHQKTLSRIAQDKKQEITRLQTEQKKLIPLMRKANSIIIRKKNEPQF